MKNIWFIFVFVAALAILLMGCGSTQDVVSDEGEKIGEVETQVTDDGIETSISINSDATETAKTGAACESDSDCGAWDALVACSNGKCIETECNFVSDCPEGTFSCFMGMCWTEEALLDRFGGAIPISKICEDVCEGCRVGKQSNKVFSGPDNVGEVRVCIDCSSDFDCKEGFWCDSGNCVGS